MCTDVEMEKRKSFAKMWRCRGLREHRDGIVDPSRCVAYVDKVVDKVEMDEMNEGHQYISREILQQYKVLRVIKQGVEMS